MKATALARATRLLEILELEQVEVDLYRGDNEDRTQTRHGRLFGGQVLSQALRAAMYTVPDERLPHSLHAYFLRPGDPRRPVLYTIDRIRDGRSFTTRRVVAVQNGEAIFNTSISFQIAEGGFDHADTMPDVPRPEALDDDIGLLDDESPSTGHGAARPRPFETRSVYTPETERTGEAAFWNPVWLRFRGELELTDPRRYALLAYASDMGLVSTGVLPHTNTPKDTVRGNIQLASLDHALWIHRPFDPTAWLLFVKRTSRADAARGLNHGEFFDCDGCLVASVSQEGLMRQRESRGK